MNIYKKSIFQKDFQVVSWLILLQVGLLKKFIHFISIFLKKGSYSHLFEDIQKFSLIFLSLLLMLLSLHCSSHNVDVLIYCNQLKVKPQINFWASAEITCCRHHLIRIITLSVIKNWLIFFVPSWIRIWYRQWEKRRNWKKKKMIKTIQFRRYTNEEDVLQPDTKWNRKFKMKTHTLFQLGSDHFPKQTTCHGVNRILI